KQGIGDGPLAGAPVMLKNLTQYKDARIDRGSRLFANYLAKNGGRVQINSPMIDAMERSGMIIAGVTNSPELGLIETTEPVLCGATRNPWNTDYTPGGSSGGSAAAIAAGIVPLAHGNDGGGSIRIPACQCGVFGLKPTRERELGKQQHRVPGDQIAQHRFRSVSEPLGARHGGVLERRRKKEQPGSAARGFHLRPLQKTSESGAVAGVVSRQTAACGSREGGSSEREI